MESKRDVECFIDELKMRRLDRRDFSGGLASVGLVTIGSSVPPHRAYDPIDAFVSPDTGEYWVMENGMGHADKKTYERISDEDPIMRSLTPGNIEEYIAAGVFQATIQNEPEPQAMYEEVKAGF